MIVRCLMFCLPTLRCTALSTAFRNDRDAIDATHAIVRNSGGLQDNITTESAPPERRAGDAASRDTASRDSDQITSPRLVTPPGSRSDSIWMRLGSFISRLPLIGPWVYYPLHFIGKNTLFDPLDWSCDTNPSVCCC